MPFIIMRTKNDRRQMYFFSFNINNIFVSLFKGARGKICHFSISDFLKEQGQSNLDGKQP